MLEKVAKKIPRGAKPEIKRIPRDKDEKRIRDLENEVEYLNDAVDFYHYYVIELHTRVTTLERIVVASGLAGFDRKEEEVLLN